MNDKNNRTILSIIVLIVLGVLVFALVRKDGISFLRKESEFILKADVNLSDTDRAFVEERLAENQAKLIGLGENASLIEKINLNFVISADYRLLGEYGKAKEILEQSMALEPLNTNAMSVYSSLLSVMGDKKGALSYINKAIEGYSKETQYWLWKFDLEKEAGMSSQKLEAIYKEALERTDNHLNIVVLYAKFLEDEKRYAEAIAKWQEAIRIEPSLEVSYQREIDRLKTIR